MFANLTKLKGQNPLASLHSRDTLNFFKVLKCMILKDPTIQLIMSNKY